MNRIEFGDCRDTMRRWASEGVKAQMCVTSPPYFGLRDYGVDGQELCVRFQISDKPRHRLPPRLACGGG